MRINDLWENTTHHICDQFLIESNGQPLYRNLPREGEDARRVKVRQRKVNGDLVEAFNAAFKERSINLFQRAVFATTTPDSPTDDAEPFYIFPINGYRFLYCTEVQRTKQDFQNAIDTLIEQFENEEEANEVLRGILTLSYTDEDLAEGISKGSEIIIYNTPSFIAIRCSSVDDYKHARELLLQ